MAAPVTAERPCCEEKLPVLELYSGIGGMHYALMESGLQFKVVAAADVNNVANEVYSHNFPDVRIIRKGIEALSVEDWEKLSPDLVTMSPPCQPFTRQGLKRDCRDKRSHSFLHVLRTIPRLKKKPNYLLIENVKGFETSETHQHLIKMVEECGYHYQEYLLSPLQFGVPNQRLRYYLLASLRDNFSCCRQILQNLPDAALQYLTHRRPCQSQTCSHSPNLTDTEESANHFCSLIQTSTDSRSDTSKSSLQKYMDHCRPISEYLDQMEINSVDQSELLLDEEQMRRFLVLDVVRRDSPKSVCFTKSYSRLLDGSGSVLQQNVQVERGNLFPNGRGYLDYGSDELERVKSMKLRFFSPREVANLMCFPSAFEFPDSCSRGQMYRSLGNSLNCHVVSVLLRLLLAPT